MRISTCITNSVTEQPTSRFTQGGLTDKYQTRTGWWERRVIVSHPSDIVDEVRAGEEYRPNLIAKRWYGNDNLRWLVLQFNNIVDLNEELYIGKVIRGPSKKRVMLDILGTTTGGNIIK